MHLLARRRKEAGFTRTEALAVLTTVLLLAGLFLSAGAGTRQTNENVVCRSNLRHLAQAWQAYALDHGDRFVGSPEGAGAQSAADGEYWATGWLDWATSGQSANQANVQVPAFVPYVGRNPRVFHCPSDRYLSAPQVARGWSARVRSYSMNYQFGPVPQDITNLRRFERFTDVPETSKFFVFVEEHPDSINDPVFITSLGGPTWADLPASFHDRSANFAMADAHVETHRWVSERTIIPVRFIFPIVTVSPTDPDFRWVFERTSVKKP
ncbi:MAG TPA: hypothetical protein PLX89_18595 [Verrucomicrobiota bacterium]|nr:hypothetical protein [Verrucomicrobiales bacterium]HRI15008.1 hypothetical protein [Verrucomicrobiota bacterium]